MTSELDTASIQRPPSDPISYQASPPDPPFVPALHTFPLFSGKNALSPSGACYHKQTAHGKEKWAFYEDGTLFHSSKSEEVSPELIRTADLSCSGNWQVEDGAILRIRLDGLRGYVVSIGKDGNIEDNLVPSPSPSMIVLPVMAFSLIATYGSYNEGDAPEDDDDD